MEAKVSIPKLMQSKMKTVLLIMAGVAVILSLWVIARNIKR